MLDGIRVASCVVVAACAALGSPALAAQEAQLDTARIAELERRLEAITRELEELRLGQEVVVPADTGVFGLAPAASKVYRVRQGVAIAGYGELHYTNFASETESGAPANRADAVDFLRAIVYVGYKFDERILFNSEIEFEHGGEEVALEFAYLDYLLRPGVGVRAGLLLVPMGFINEVHEPPTFLGTTRPETERQILPSTWRENGLGVFGAAGPVAFRAYVVNGFRGSGFGPTGLRGGRQSGAQALAEDLAAVARVDVSPALGVLVGGSAYLGNAGQGDTVAGRRVDARTFVAEAHAQVRARGWDVRALGAVATVDDAGALNAIRGIAPGSSASVGARLLGGYVQLGYDVLARARTEHQLIPYVRYEALDTQARVPAGYAADPATDRRIWSLGLAWKPIPGVAVKADAELHRNDAGTGVDRFNLNVSYLF